MGRPKKSFLSKTWKKGKEGTKRKFLGIFVSDNKPNPRTRKRTRKTYKRSSVLGRRGQSGFWSWFV